MSNAFAPLPDAAPLVPSMQTDLLAEAAGTLLSSAAASIALATDPDATQREWLETDGLGGFASGTVSGVRTRRYHALLLSATLPPTGRQVLVNGVEAWLEGPDGVTFLTTHRYKPNVIYPSGWQRITHFDTTPWPTWRFALSHPAAPGDALTHEVFAAGDGGDIVLRWHLHDAAALDGASGPPRRLFVRPLLSVRDYHALHRENPQFDFAASGSGGRISWRPYADRPAVSALSNGSYQHAPEWFRQFFYTEERDRGLDDSEDLASPGIFVFELTREPALMVLRAGDSRDVRVRERVADIERAERARRAAPLSASTPLSTSPSTSTSPSPLPAIATASAEPNVAALLLAAQCYFAERGSGETVLAGFPWFTDWGRDTFIALRGLALVTGRADRAAAILTAWAATVSEGMLPNRFPDGGEAPEYNAVDASLWFIVALHAYLLTEHAEAAERVDANHCALLRDAADSILEGYMRGTRFGIAMTADGLLHAGQADSQLTWMDARVAGRAATPRIGKPVEVQALWINALRIASTWRPDWAAHADLAQASFTRRFVHAAKRDDDPLAATAQPERGVLYDVVDVDGIDGALDASLRPNQIFAAGGLPFRVVDDATAAAIVEQVERVLWTPLGLRTLAPSDPRYVGHYQGTPEHRDNAYHQGTVWPWLMGAFVEAWLRIHAFDAHDAHDAKDTHRASESLDAQGVKAGLGEIQAYARERFVAPLDAHLHEAGIGHLSEIADGDAPHVPRGAPFQAWSLAERLRIESLLRNDANVTGSKDVRSIT